MAGNTPPLLTLPVELVQAIFDKLLPGPCDKVKRDILSLRLINREVSALVENLYLNVFYSTRRHLITRYSLEYLVTVSADPRLRRKLRRIELVPVKLKYEREKAESKMWKQWIEERDGLFKRGLAMKLLTQALKNLAEASISPSLALGALKSEPQWSRAFGTLQFFRDLNVTPPGSLPVYRNTELEQAGRLLVHAIAASKFPVKKFSIPQDETSMTFEPFIIKGSRLSDFSNALAHLKSLTLSIRNVKDQESGQQALVQALKCATGLEEINLQFMWHSEPNIKAHKEDPKGVITLAQGFANSRLKRITLRRACMHEQDFYAFLSHHGGSLVYLELSDFRIVAPANTIFAWLAAELSLDEIKLTRLFDLKLAELRNLALRNEAIHYNNGYARKEEVKKGLRRAARTARYVAP